MSELCQCGRARIEHDLFDTRCPRFTPPVDDPSPDRLRNMTHREFEEKYLGYDTRTPPVDEREKALETQIVFGWRQHCTSGELKDGEPRKDFSDYRIGYIDGHSAASEQARQEVERLKLCWEAAMEIVDAHWNEGDVRAAIRKFEKVNGQIARQALAKEKS